MIDMMLWLFVLFFSSSLYINDFTLFSFITMATGNQTSMLPSLSSGTNNPLGNLASIESSATIQAPNMAQTERGTKEWHKSVTQGFRNNLVHKL